MSHIGTFVCPAIAINRDDAKPLHRQVVQLSTHFDRVIYEHVPRERNAEADRLANLGVDTWLADQGRTR